MGHAWRDASIATALISSAPTLILPFIPNSATKPGSALQRVLLCFAVGGMLGDVFLHLLPHLLMHTSGDHHDHSHHHVDTLAHDHDHHSHGHHDHDHDHDNHGGHGDLGEESHPPLKDDVLFDAAGLFGHGDEEHAHTVGDLLLPLLVLGGFLLFFISERVVRSLLGEGAAHSHGTAPSDDAAKRKKDDDRATCDNAGGSSLSDRAGGRGTKLKIAGILNLAADALHNFSDGIAIAASFASGRGLGYSTTLATLLHELPHEIGDFAVLVQSGMSKWQAIGAQFATAIAAFAGTAVGLLATGYAGIEQPLLAATAGGFVYVSCVAVMPEILNNPSTSLLQTIAEVGAMCAGIALMAGVALLE